MRRTHWVIALVVAGCGRVGFDPFGANEVDGSTAGANCDPYTDVVEQVAINGADNEWEPAISPDGLALAYVSYSQSAGMWAATRTSTDEMFGPPRMLAELSTADVEHGPLWSADGTKLYFTRELGVSQPMSATYLGDAMFAAPIDLDLPHDGSSFALSRDELDVYMTVDLGGGDLDLRHAKRADASSAWIFDGEVDGANRGGFVDAYPELDEPRNDLYYQRANPGTVDLVVMHRAARGDPFGAPVLVTTVTSPGSITGDPSITADGQTLAFASDRPGGTGASDIYLSHRVCR